MTSIIWELSVSGSSSCSCCNIPFNCPLFHWLCCRSGIDAAAYIVLIHASCRHIDYSWYPLSISFSRMVSFCRQKAVGPFCAVWWGCQPDSCKNYLDGPTVKTSGWEDLFIEIISLSGSGAATSPAKSVTSWQCYRFPVWRHVRPPLIVLRATNFDPIHLVFLVRGHSHAHSQDVALDFRGTTCFPTRGAQTVVCKKTTCLFSESVEMFDNCMQPAVKLSEHLLQHSNTNFLSVRPACALP